jgi:iron complex transport system substrate-binding protein
MHRTHRWHAAVVFAILVAAWPAAAAPQHVVSAFLCTDEYVFRLLPRSRIAALSYLAADRHPVVSTIADDVKGIALVHASAEEVLAHHPDLVVMYAGTDVRLHAQLHDAGVPVFDVTWANSLAEVRSVTRALGRALDAQAQAEAMLSAMDSALAQAHAIAGRARLRTLIYEPNGYATADGVTDQILGDAGLINAAREIGATRSGTIPVEAIVANPPALLLLNIARESRPSLADLVLAHPALSQLGSQVHVARLALTPLLCPGPWSASLAPGLARMGRALARSPGAPL